MKILISILSLLFLMNCYTYKNIDYTNKETIIPTKNYVLKLKNNKTIIAKELKIENENYIYKNSENIENHVPIEMVLKIEEREFSNEKTAVLAVGTVAAIVIVTSVVLSALRDIGNKITSDIIR